MNKLGLTGLFGFVAVALIAMGQKQPENKRDELLMSLAQGISSENLPGCQKALVELAKKFGHQEKVQKCIFTAIDDIMYQFGDREGFSILDRIEAEMAENPLAKAIGEIRPQVQNYSQQENVARDIAVRELSQLLRAAGLPQFNYGEGVPGVKRTIPVVGLRMTPDEFLLRYETMAPVKRQPSLRA